MYSIFPGADVGALVPFCPAQFNVTHIIYICKIIFEQINDDDDDDI